MTFYERFEQLCKGKGVSPNKACIEIGLSRSTAAKWKFDGGEPNAKSLNKIANYFGVSIDEIIGKTPKTRWNDNTVVPSYEVSDDIQKTTGMGSPEKQKLLDAIEKMDREELLRLLKIIDAIAGK